MEKFAMPNYFYIDQSGAKQGPINDQLLRSLAAHGAITPQTQLQADTGHKGLAGQITGLEFGAATPQPPMQTPPNPFVWTSGSSFFWRLTDFTFRDLLRYSVVNMWVCRIFYSICCVAAVLVGIAGTANASEESEPVLVIVFMWIFAALIVLLARLLCERYIVAYDWLFCPHADTVTKLNTYFDRMWFCAVVGFPLCIIVIGIPIVIFATIYAWMLHYQLWKLIPKEIASTTPGKAVGYMFIPFFQCYWTFVSYLGLCIDMNKTLEQRGIQYRTSTGLGWTSCILLILTYITTLTVFGEIIFGIACLVVDIYLYKSVKNGAILILEQDAQ